MELYAHQKNFLHQNAGRTMLVWDTGTGKTRTSVEWQKYGYEEGDMSLVICPKALRENWHREIEKWGGQRFDVYTKEEFRKYWDTLPFYKHVICDEAHYFAGMKSQMSRALIDYQKKWNWKNRLLLLSATPYMSTPWNIFRLATILGYQWGYWTFKTRFFNDKYIGKRVVPEVKPNIEDEIAALVRDIADVVHIDECVDVPEQVFEVEEFSLTDAQQRAKSKEYDPNPIVRYTRHHQIENGVLKGDGHASNETFACYKNDRIIELCEEHAKIAIVCRYNQQIEMLQELIYKKLKIPALVINGQVKDRDEIVQRVERAGRAIILINAACSEGYELPSVGVCVFASLSFSYKDAKQMYGRFLRINKLKKNVYKFLVADGIDREVHNSIQKKRDFDIAIYAKENNN